MLQHSTMHGLYLPHEYICTCYTNKQKVTIIDNYNIFVKIKKQKPTVNMERFTGLNFHGFHNFQEYCKSFSMNICASPLYNKHF